MKILILPSWYLPHGGYFCQEQAIGLQAVGVDVAILANVELPWTMYGVKTLFFRWDFFRKEEKGIPTYRHFSRRIPRCEKLNFRRWVNSTLRQFDRYVSQNGYPDVIHAHSSMWAGYAAYLIHQKYNIPYVITEHRGRFSEKAESLQATIKEWYEPFLIKAFSEAAFIIPVSGLLCKKINTYSGGHSRIAAISNIVDTQFFSLKKRDSHSCFFTFFTANSFDDAKGYDVLLKAFDLVCEISDKVRLRIAGGGFDNPVFRSCLAECKNADKITFAGFLQKTEVRQNLWDADAFVLASRVESQSIAVLEALSTGLPVVCTDVVPEEVLVSGTGYRVKINRPDLLANAMVEMVNTRSSFSEAFISEHAASIAGSDVVIQKLLEVYKTVLKP